jgi:hypothetical protein
MSFRGMIKQKNKKLILKNPNFFVVIKCLLLVVSILQNYQMKLFQ